MGYFERIRFPDGQVSAKWIAEKDELPWGNYDSLKIRINSYEDLFYVRAIGDKEYNIEGREIFKDPITDDGTKKSAKGLLCVKEIMIADGLGKLHHSSYQMIDQCTPEQEEEGALLTVFLDGKLVKEYTLEEIRERIKRNLYE